MKKLSYFLFVMLLSSFVKSQSLTKEITINKDRYIYSCSYSNNKFVSDFKIINNLTIKYQTFFTLDTFAVNYKLLQHQKVVDSAQNLNFLLIESDYSNFSDKIVQLIDTLFSVDAYDRNLIQSIFFSQSNFKNKTTLLFYWYLRMLTPPRLFFQ